MLKEKKLAIGSAVFMLAIIIAGYSYYQSCCDTPLDQLCLDTKKRAADIECPALVAERGVFRPGAIVHRGKEFVSLPASYLDTCLVPGASLSLRQPQSLAAIPSGTTFQTLDASASANGKIDIPRLATLSGSGATDLSLARQVKISYGEGNWDVLDENAVAESLASCQIKAACIENIRAGRDQLVNGVVTAKGLTVSLLNSAKAELALGGVFKSEGSTAGSIDLKLAPQGAVTRAVVTDREVVLGVTLVRQHVIDGARVCEKSVLIPGRDAEFGTITTAEADVQVSVSGGGRGGIEGTHEGRAVLGIPAEVSRVGAERSECNAGSVSQSSATATGLVLQDSGSLRFKGRVEAAGGHYRTVPTCLLGTPGGWTGHDNAAVARVSMMGQLRFILRTEDAFNLVVSSQGLPVGTEIRVSSPGGETVATLAATDGALKSEIVVKGAGVYLLRATPILAIQRQGQDRGAASLDAYISISSADKGGQPHVPDAPDETIVVPTPPP